MKRWMMVLLVALFGMPLAGCHVDSDDDDDVELKVDAEGSEKSVKIDKD